MIEQDSTTLLKRLAIIGVMIAALYFVYVAGFDRGARETARAFRGGMR